MLGQYLIPVVVFCPVSKDGKGPVSRRLGSFRLIVTAFKLSVSLAPRSGVDVHDELILLKPA